MNRIINLILFICILMSYVSPAQSLTEKLEAVSLEYTRHEEADQPYQYRLFTPAKDSVDGSILYPLVIYLHGSGGVGDDNEKQLTGGNLKGAHIWAIPENQEVNPCFVCAPQTPSRWNSGKVIALAVMLMEKLNIDSDRIYITGQSMGGVGTWSAISVDPDFFAAAIPVCGIGYTDAADNLVASGLPIWVFHGEIDSNVDVSASRNMVRAIEEAGGLDFIYTHINWQTGSKDTLTSAELETLIESNPRYIYSEFEGVGHSSWEKGYVMPLLQTWLFRQDKGITKIEKNLNSCVSISYALFQNYPNPFNPTTTVSYYLPKHSDVTLSIYDITGRQVEILVNQHQNAGNYQIQWNASRYSSGVYFYKFQAWDFQRVRKMLLIK